ncbi:hypothetical protein [Mumia zhuanghuii]|uniref:hypothetical protein n=1 Tax=Mumia zhuanghuii TaxID=2585211 RepID=UPI00129CEA06|nr:hypothetical protein [Mumia zhuanghuii]
MLHVEQRWPFLRLQKLRRRRDRLLELRRPHLHDMLLAGFQRGPHFKFLRLE